MGKIVKKSITPKEVFSIKNTEQRIIAITYIGGKKLEKECGAKIIDAHPNKEYGQIIELQGIKDSLGDNYRFLKAYDPSKKDYVYIRIAPDMKDVVEAQTKCYGLERFNINYNPIKRT